MRSAFGATVVALLALVCGCASWQANKGSQAVDVNPFGPLTGDSVFQPSNGPGYMNGQAQDMRTR